MRKVLFLCLCLLLCIDVIGQEKYNYRYWFDVNDLKSIDGISQSKKWNINVDVSELNDALHLFNIQVQDSAGVWSSPMSKYFYKKTTNDYSVKYWFDRDITMAKELYEKGTTYIDVSHLRDGLHSISSVVNSSGVLSKVETHYFLKLPQTVGIDDMTYFSFIDDKAYISERVSANGGLLNWRIDVDSLSLGLHKLQVFIVTPSGVASSLASGFFLRVPTQNEFTTLKCYYIIDGVINEGKNDKFIQAGTYSNGIYHFDLDVVNLTDGLHKLSYMLIGEDGIVTSSKSSFFYKIPVGGNAITKWEYWTNGNDSLVHTTTLEVPQNPLQLILLLPIESNPIRSSCYEFRVEDKKPVLYAKNDINLRFYDKSGRSTDLSKLYVDENVRQELNSDEMPILQSNVITRVNRPAENEIKWYKFEAEDGDSLVLYTDKACYIDVFSPTGESVYTACGAESVKPSGTHLYETGTFYVGVHDMTAKNGDEIKLNFQLIDKYAVLNQDVHKVGNGGISTITFNGNGYLYLDSISIDNGNTIIKDFDIKYKSNTEIEATFDFNGAELGKYNITLHFVDDKLVLSNALTVETAKAITLTSNVEFDTQFLRGTSSEYTVTMSNNGNMTAYYVPIELKLVVNSIENISDIKFEGDITSLKSPNELLNDSIDEDIKLILLEVSESINDLSQFVVYRDSVSNMDYGLSQVIITLPPYSKKQIKVSILTNGADVSLYAYMTNDWYPLVIRNESRGIKPLWTEEQRGWMCCQKERFKCSANIVANIASSLMPPGAGCATSLALTGLNTAYDVWCSDGATVKERWDKYIKSNGNSLACDLIQSAVSCVTWFYDKRIKKLREDLKLASRLGSTAECDRIMVEIATAKTMMKSAVRGIYEGVCTMILGEGCVEAFSEKKPNCPPNPGGGGGTSTPRTAVDPNDIRGYMAESGSKFIGKEVKTVNYMIEFENDSTFATASAHRIELIDTLDANTLDISSIVPKEIKLGKYEYSFEADNKGVATIDLRPNINAIAQVVVNVSKNGILNCEIISLDPMTMEPTDDIMAGILPVNDSEGRGQGYFTFKIGLKEGMADGTEISNKADILFDTNEPISTPYWINTTDYVEPVSKIDTIECVSDTIVNIRFSGEDNRSGIWRYTLYVQPGDGSDWFLAKENIEADSCEYMVYPDINYGFCVVATDSAGNVEPKLLKREISYTGFTKGDANSDGVIDAQDVVLAISKYLGEEPKMNFVATDVVQDGVIDAQDVVGIQNIYLHSNVNLYSVKRQRRIFKKE